MAVDATHFHTNREVGNFVQGNSSFPMGYGFVQGPVSGTTTATEALMPMYGLGMAACVKSESGVSYAIPVVSRKRTREADADNNNLQFPPPAFINQQPPLNFLSEDFSSNFQQQQSEIDRLIAQHTMKVRIEMEEKRKNNWTRIIRGVEDVILNKLKAKDEEIDKMGKLNWALQDKLKSLCLENQIWRQLALTNEATANALRTNLEQVLAHVQEDQIADDADAESCCGSNVAAGDHRGNVNSRRMCRNCGKEEASVLIMPCRHLCLCYLCGPLLQKCPICNSPKNVMVRVNLLP